MQHKSLTVVNNFENTEGIKKLQFRGFVFYLDSLIGAVEHTHVSQCQEPHFFIWPCD